MNYSKMSVAIPYHGRPDFFRETLENLYNQTSKDFEIVIGDDSNSEKDIQDLKSLVDEYIQKGLNIRVVRTEPNLGAIKNTLQAIKACKNEIVRILHTDDCIAPTTIELELSIFNQKPDTFFAFHNASVFRESFIPNESKKWSDKTWIENWLKNKNYTHSILPSCFVFKKEVLDEVGFFDTNFEFMYDWEFQIRLFEYSFLNKKRVVEIEAGYVGWRISKTSESYNKSLICYKDSRKVAKLLKESTKRLNKYFNDPSLYKKVKQFKKGFKSRLEYEYDITNHMFDLPIKFKLKNLCKKIKNNIFSIKKNPDRKVITILGIKIKLLRKNIKDKKMLSHLLNQSNVPLVLNNKFIYYTAMPVNAADSTKVCSEADLPKVGIILQGPIIYQNNFTFETIRMYKNMFKNQNVSIILSTWADQSERTIEDFKNLGIEVVLQDKIEYSGRGNLNYQIITTKAGVLKAEELNCEYVIKTRTDQRFYKTDILEFMFNLLSQFPLEADVRLNKRIVACSFNSFLYRLYGISDMFLFGTTQDIKKYWDIDFDNHSVLEWANKTNLELFESYCPESFIARQFLKNIGHNVTDTLEDSLNVLRDYFVFIDKETLKLFWPKYSNKSSRWDFYYPNPMDECTFVDWLNLYSNKNKINFYCNQKWDKLPKF